MQERAEAAQRELGEVKERAWALLEQKEDELRVVRARPALLNCPDARCLHPLHITCAARDV